MRRLTTLLTVMSFCLITFVLAALAVLVEYLLIPVHAWLLITALSVAAIGILTKIIYEIEIRKYCKKTGYSREYVQTLLYNED